MKVSLAHGGGGEATKDFIKKEFIEKIKRKSLGAISLDEMDDGASFFVGNKEVVVTTDSHTVRPIFFPGGDIGKLAIAGTVNDIAVMGARPIAITSSFIFEEGFEFEKLRKIVKSIDDLLEKCNIAMLAGDTKVVERGKIDEIVINTSGIGICDRGKTLKDSCLRPGDKIIINGSIAEHGTAVMVARGEFEFEGEVKSDVAPLVTLIDDVMDIGGIHAMKDPTRGGLLSALYEFAEKSEVKIEIYEEDIPIKEEVLYICELLGIDPLCVANEGKVILSVDSEYAEDVLKKMRKNKFGKDAEIIGEVKEGRARVIGITEIGGRRILRPPYADPLPRIC